MFHSIFQNQTISQTLTTGFLLSASIFVLFFIYLAVRRIIGLEIPPSAGFYKFVKFVMGLFFRLYNAMKVHGREHHPETGPYVIVANHSSIYDGIILGIASPRTINIMVKKEAFSNYFTDWFLRKTFAFPIQREKPELTVIKKAFRILTSGNVLAIFPEGTRNVKGLVRPFKPGAIRFATKTRVPIVPAYIANSHIIAPKGKLFPRPHKLSVSFGELLDVAAMLKAGISEEEIQNEVYRRVCDIGKELTGQDVTDLPEESSETSAQITDVQTSA